MPATIGLIAGGVVLGAVAGYALGRWQLHRSGAERRARGGPGLGVAAGFLLALAAGAVVESWRAETGVAVSALLALAALATGVAVGSSIEWAVRLRDALPDGARPDFPVLAPAMGLPCVAIAAILVSVSAVPASQAPPATSGHATSSPSAAPSAQPGRVAAPGCAVTPAPPATASGALLTAPWVLHTAAGAGSSECYQTIAPDALAGRTTIRVTYDLHGLTALGQDASALIIDQGSNDTCVNQPGCRWHYVSLSAYGRNGYDGTQSVSIPLVAFPGLDPSRPVNGVLHVRFWHQSSFTVEIRDIGAS